MWPSPARGILAYLFLADRHRLAAAAGVLTAKHSPGWLLPLITASVIDTVVQHQPVSRLWTSTGVLLFILLVNHPLHLLDVRLLYGTVRRMGHRPQVRGVHADAAASTGSRRVSTPRSVSAVPGSPAGNASPSPTP
nr:hypothetical protein [Streptomyces cellulosae]